jgi:hypothetical protein
MSFRSDALIGNSAKRVPSVSLQSCYSEAAEVNRARARLMIIV